MKTYQYITHGQTYEVQLDLSKRYGNGRQALILFHQGEEGHLEPFMTASVNMVEQPCPEGQVWLKNWSENEGVLDWLADQGIIERVPTAVAPAGHVFASRHLLLEVA